MRLFHSSASASLIQIINWLIWGPKTRHGGANAKQCDPGHVFRVQGIVGVAFLPELMDISRCSFIVSLFSFQQEGDFGDGRAG